MPFGPDLKGNSTLKKMLA